jgi:hypothetical protein
MNDYDFVKGKPYSWKISLADAIEDFRLYLVVKWKWLGLPEPTPLQLEIAGFIQQDIPYLIIEGFRGIAKSWVTASFAEWNWLKNKDYRVMIVSGNQSKADEISLFIRTCIDTFPLLEPLRWEHWEKQHARWGIKQFNVKGSPVDIAPSCKAVSIGGMLVGSRAHLIIGDDVETPTNSDTVDMREKLLNAVGEFTNILLPGGQVKLLGTPQSEESIYSELKNRGAQVVMWPARVPEPTGANNYGGCLSPIIREMYESGNYGAPTEPRRFPDDVLCEKEALLSTSAFKLQFMLDTSLADKERYPLRLKDLVVMPLDKQQGPMTLVWSGLERYKCSGLPQIGFSGDFCVEPMLVGEQWKPYEYKALMIDPSGRGDNETAWFVIGEVSGRFYLLDFGGELDGYSPATIGRMLELAKEHKVNSVLYEENYGGGMFGEILKAAFNSLTDGYSCEIKGIHSTGNKEKRIVDTLEPVVRQHRLIADTGAMERDARLVTHRESDGSNKTQTYSLQYQLTRMTRQKGCLRYDDRIDCLAIYVGYRQQTLGVNSAKATATDLKANRLKEIRKMLEGGITFGGQKKQRKENSWI